MTKKQPIIYIFGNPLLDFDNVPILLHKKLSEKFPDIEFIEIDPNENLHPKYGRLIIIDTIVDIDKVVVIDDIEKIDTIEQNPNYSLHDFDLGFNLQLLKKIGTLTDILIFGVPQDIEKQVIFEQLVSHIKDRIDEIKAS